MYNMTNFIETFNTMAAASSIGTTPIFIRQHKKAMNLAS